MSIIRDRMANLHLHNSSRASSESDHFCVVLKMKKIFSVTNSKYNCAPKSWQGVPIENCQKLLTVALKRCILDPKLVKPKCV